MNFKTAAWNLLIANGGALRDDGDNNLYNWDKSYSNYYGSGWDYDFVKTVEALELMEEHDIQFDKMGEPHQETSYHFNGTFTDTQLSANHLYGKLIVNDQEFLWGVETEDVQFSELLAMLTKLGKVGLVVQVDEVNIDDSVKTLRDRVEKFRREYSEREYALKSYWSYHCKL